MTCSGSCSTGYCTGAESALAPGCSEMKSRIRSGASPQSPRPPAASAGARDTCRNPSPISYKELRGEVIDLQIDREINPTDGHLSDAFERLNDDHGSVYADAQMAFDIAARREVSQDDFGLEPLGLAMWSAKLPEDTGQEALSQDETRLLLRTVARILATENILLPPDPLKPWDWPFDDRMQPYERQRDHPWESPHRRQRRSLQPPALQEAGQVRWRSSSEHLPPQDESQMRTNG